MASAVIKMSRRYQTLPCRAFCVADRCTWTALAEGDHAPLHIAAGDHVRGKGHVVKVVMTTCVILGPAQAEGADRG